MAEFISESDNKIINEITETNLLWVPSDRFSDSAILSMVFTRPETSAMLSGYFKNILSLIASGNEEKPDESVNKSASLNIRNEFIIQGHSILNRLETIVHQG